MNIKFDTSTMVDAKQLMPGSFYNIGDCEFLVQYSDYTFGILSMITRGSVYKNNKELHILKWILLRDAQLDLI